MFLRYEGGHYGGKWRYVKWFWKSNGALIVPKRLYIYKEASERVSNESEIIKFIFIWQVKRYIGAKFQKRYSSI